MLQEFSRDCFFDTLGILHPLVLRHDVPMHKRKTGCRPSTTSRWLWTYVSAEQKAALLGWIWLSATMHMWTERPSTWNACSSRCFPLGVAGARDGESQMKVAVAEMWLFVASVNGSISTIKKWSISKCTAHPPIPENMNISWITMPEECQTGQAKQEEQSRKGAGESLPFLHRDPLTASVSLCKTHNGWPWIDLRFLGLFKPSLKPLALNF